MKKLFLSPVRPIRVVAAFLSFTCYHNLSAAALVKETFEYTPGTVVGQTGGTGWGGAWVGGTGAEDVTTGTFSTPTNYNYSTGSTYLAVTPDVNSTAEVSRLAGASFNLNPASSLTLYYSILFSRYDSFSGGNEWISLLSMRNGSTELVRFGGTTSEALSIDTYAPSGTTQNATTSSGTYSVGTTFDNAPQYLAVIKMVLNPSGTNDEFYYSIFPASGTVPATEPAFWALTMSADTSGTLDTFYLLAARTSGTLNVDNIYLGLTYQSVIPEPGTTGLFLGVALAGLFGYKRHLKNKIISSDTGWAMTFR